MPEIEIRPVTADDIPFLLKLEHFYTSEFVWQMELMRPQEDGIRVDFREIRYPRPVKLDYPRSVHDLEKNWHAHSGLLVATWHDMQIGYVGISLHLLPGVAWVSDLVVDRKMRRQGIGSALLLAVLDWGESHGMRAVVIEVQPKNHPAIRLAQKMGFTFYGYLENYYRNGDTCLFFARQLAY
jgi:ribosomal protein S18 acetylase RimI-like enzyme